ncbi:hypothetical protein IC582_017241 [Cucumis melo]
MMSYQTDGSCYCNRVPNPDCVSKTPYHLSNHLQKEPGFASHAMEMVQPKLHTSTTQQ